MSKIITHNHNNDGVDRRGFLNCMAWAGSGVLWTMAGGTLTSAAFGQKKMKEEKGELHFVQISDSHMGFNKPANADVTATLRATIDKINGLPQQPDFIIHTGDLSHTSKPAEFDTLDQVLKGAKPKQVFFVPGEHDTSVDDGQSYLERYGKQAKGRGWYSFNHKDVHFVGLSNVAALEGLGKLGPEQIQWLEADLKNQSASRPVVVFAQIPLWSVLPGLGLGNRRQRPGTWISQTVWIGHGAQWAYPPGDAKGRGQRHVPHGHVNCLSATRSGHSQGTGTNESSGRQTSQRPGHHRRKISHEGAQPRGRGLDPGRRIISSCDRDDGTWFKYCYLGRMRAVLTAGWPSMTASAWAQARPDGRALFEKRCGGCHALDRDKEGPRLGGVYGRTAGTVDSFQYSEALKKSGNSNGLMRTLEQMAHRIHREILVPDNDMTFHVEKLDERSAIIAYLKNPGK